METHEHCGKDMRSVWDVDRPSGEVVVILVCRVCGYEERV